MTRVNVFHEGVDTFMGNRLVAVGALKLSDGHPEGEALPVVLNFVPSMIIAYATDMQRTEDGVVSFEIEWVNPRFERIYSDLTIAPYAKIIEEGFSDEHQRKVVKKAALKALSYFDVNSPDVGRSLPV